MSSLSAKYEPPTPVIAPSSVDEPVGPLLALRPLDWLIRLRWVLLAIGFAAVAIERAVQPAAARPAQVVWALVALTLVNAGWWVTRRVLEKKSLPEGGRDHSKTLLAFAHAQIGVDLLILTVLLRYTGGVASPLAIFYVFHTALGVLLLPPGHTMIPGLWAIALYAGLTIAELSNLLTPRYPLLPEPGSPDFQVLSPYVAVAFGSVSGGILGTLYLIGTVAKRLRRRDEQLRVANAALRKSQEAIRDIQGRRSRFMQTAAHRLKSPLATVQTLAGLIHDDLVKGEEARAVCGRITRCCSEGIEHVTELLTLARVQDADPQRHRTAQSDVGEVVAELCERYESLARSRGIRFTCTIPQAASLLAGVEKQDLSNGIGNLIDNAVKYTPSGGSVAVRVAKCADPERGGPSNWIVIHVDDTGMGFDAEALKGANTTGASVFDAFRRGNNALAAGISGSGLGLAIVRAVIEQAGGRIEVRSQRGHGTQFALWLPPGQSQPLTPAVRNTRATHALTDVTTPTHSQTSSDTLKKITANAAETNHALN